MGPISDAQVVVDDLSVFTVGVDSAFPEESAQKLSVVPRLLCKLTATR